MTDKQKKKQLLPLFLTKDPCFIFRKQTVGCYCNKTKHSLRTNTYFLFEFTIQLIRNDYCY